MQSPIDVTTEEVLFDPELRNNPLQISYWRASAAVAAADEEEEEGGVGSSHEKLLLVNTGNTARLDVLNASSCKRRHFLLTFLSFCDVSARLALVVLL